MNILFDIGRVLLDFDFESSMRRLVEHRPADAFERLMRTIEARDDFESGHVSPEEFVARSVRMPGLPEIDPDAFVSAWRNVFTRNLPMWDAVSRLKQSGRHRLILFSNTNAIHCPWIFNEFPELQQFDGRVLSYEVGAVKPDAAIYEHAIREFELDPERTRYIDDLPQNIGTGIRFGFRCHLHQIARHDDFESWLESELARD